MITSQQLRQMRTQMTDDALIGSLARKDTDFAAFASKVQAKDPEIPAKFIINKYYLGNAGGKTQDVYRSPEKVKDSEKMAQESYSALGFAKNAIKSGGQFAGDLYQAARHPLQTGKTLGLAAVGGAVNTAESIVGGITGKDVEGNVNAPGEDVAAGIGQFYKDRYGSVGQAADTLYNDPVGALSDAAGVLSLGAGAAAKAGTVGKLGGLTRAGQAAGKVATTIDPLMAAGKLAKGAGKVGGEVLGLTTGAGNAPNVIAGAGKAAANSGGYGSDALKAMRGQTGPATIVDKASEALDLIKQQRADAYRPKLEAISRIKGRLDASPIYAELNKQLARFGVKDNSLDSIEDTVRGASQADSAKALNEMVDKPFVPLDDDGLDFSRVVMDEADKAKVRQVVEIMKQWGSQADDLTPAGLDKLKQILDGFYSPNGKARAFVTALKGKVRETLVNNVDGYEAMVKEYEKYSDEITEMQKSLSLTDSASADTAIKKLTSIVRQNNEFRATLVQRLKEVSGSDIPGMAAGSAMNPATPRGIMRTVAGASAAFSFINPWYLMSLPVTSPRLIGELLYALGYTHGQVSNVIKVIRGKVPLPPEFDPALRQSAVLPARTDQE